MPRATEPKPRVGGAMAPEATGFIARRQEFGRNRILEAMRQRGAKERGKAQATAQLQTTQMGIKGQKEVEAMRMVEADRRAAERIEGQELDRKFNMKLQQITEKGASGRLQTQLDHEKAMWKGKKELVEGYTNKSQAQERFNKRVEAKLAKMRTKMMLNLGNRMLDSEEATQKWKISTHQLIEENKRDTASFEILKDEVAERIGTTDIGETPLVLGARDLPLGVQLFDSECTRAQLPQISAKLLTSAGQSKVEKMFTSGELRGFDYVKGGAIIDGLIIGLNNRIKEISGEDVLKEVPKGEIKLPVWKEGKLRFREKPKEALTETGRKVEWLKAELNRVMNMKQVWRNIAESKETMKDNADLTLKGFLSKPNGIYIGESVGKNLGELEAIAGDNLEAMRTIVNNPSFFDYSSLFSPEEIEATKNPHEKEMMMELMDIWGEEE